MNADLIIKNIRTLYTPFHHPPIHGMKMNEIQTFNEAFIAIKDGKFIGFGEGPYDKFLSQGTQIYDALHCIVIPGLIDSHTHLVHGGSREAEFSKKIAGVPYIDILLQGGGIFSTVESTRNATFKELYDKAMNSLKEMLLFGVTTIEAKSGYGLNQMTEVLQLEVAKKCDNDQPITIISTYLGAHALPKEFKGAREVYINQVLSDMKTIKDKDLAKFVDVFCEKDVFTLEETSKILNKAISLGFKVRLHSDEMVSIGGTKLALDLKANSIDHLMAITDQDIDLLASSKTIGNLLPSTSFFLNKEYAPARKMIEKGCAVSISSDYNPGSAPSENFQFTMQLAGNKLKMTPSEILTASTINPAYGLGLSDHVGSIQIGKQADFSILKASNLDYVIYHYGVNHTQDVFKNGKLVVRDKTIVKGDK
ncbi:MAG: imidazolonepropionase [Firmicutes bacterium]|nr:imidazolonepropionase [Bacillota bacterium]